jgi:Transposase DDE domain
MHVKGFLHKTLSSVISKKRLVTLILLVEGLLISKKLSVTELGRGINSPIQERSAIRRSDRFMGNRKLHQELKAIYAKQIDNLIGSQKRPRVIVDWTHIPNTDFHALRAALVTKGRALTLYEEVHPEKKLGNTKIEKRFLKTLSELLPITCRPIIITDAGFRNPWFKQVVALGWDFIGRIRGTHRYYDGKHWLSCKGLYSKATKLAKHIGKVLLCKANTITVHLFLLKEKPKKELWRKKYKKKGGGKRDVSNYRRSAKEPWLLASSLPGNSPVKIKRVIKLYKTRMQIEEGFRDLKNPKYGFGLRNAYSRDRKRIEVLLLIAMLASLIAWLCGYVAEKNEWHYQFQVNSIKTRRILSLFFLGCQVIKRHFEITIDMLESALQEIRYLPL